MIGFAWAIRLALGGFLMVPAPILLTYTSFSYTARFGLTIASVLIGFLLFLTNVVKRYKPSDSSTAEARDSQDSVGDEFIHSAEVAASAVELSRNKYQGYYLVAGQRIDEVTVSRLMLLLTEPRRYQGRIVEDITPMQRQVRRKLRTSLVLDFPASAAIGCRSRSIDSGAVADHFAASAGSTGTLSGTGPSPATAAASARNGEDRSTTVGLAEPENHDLDAELRRSEAELAGALYDKPTSKDDDDFVFYPLTLIKKGELHDNFHVGLKGEDTTVTLTYEEYCQLMVVVVRSLAYSCRGLPSNLYKRVDKLSLKVLNLVCTRKVDSDNYEDAKAQSKRLTDKAKTLIQDIEQAVSEPGRFTGLIDEIASFGARFYEQYPVILIIPIGAVKNNRAIVTLEHDAPPRWHRQHSVSGRLKMLSERISAYLGGRPGELEIDLRRASWAQSYHITVHGSEDSYLADQRIRGTENYGMAGHPKAKLPGRFRRPLGQPYFRGYYRNLELLPTAHSDELSVTLTFFEVPPGSIGKASIASISALILTYVIGLTLPIPQDSTGFVGFAALILAFPAASAAWVGLDKVSDKSLLGTELSARASALSTFALSLAAASIFILDTQKVIDTSTSLPTLGINDWLWVCLVSAMFLNTFLSIVSWAGRMARYYLVTRRSNEQYTTDIRLRGALK
ncbi:hypothetical protein [Actinomycetospora callitridis]|uniref:hypothetical protein n=1 Tax=Actinomycetospora callitridis TaxID=913944 RepID=UPI002365288E|nr:hypothetical protein [Actinomycetospora callitridis]MDD7920975.1 hypothetical protein [Actinomycetospora callitridis]